MGALPTDLRESHSVGADTREWLVGRDGCPALADHRIQLCGISEARPGFRFVRHAWTNCQVLACCEGRGQVLVDGAWRPLAPGEAYLAPSGVLHAYHCPPGAEWRIAWAMFTEPEDAAPLLALAAPAVVACDHRPLHDAIANLHREMVGAREPALLRQWTDLVAVLARRALAPAAGDGVLWRLWEQVDADLGRSWTLGDLARLAGLGPEQLRRRCQRAHGASPMAHLTRLRMRRAAGLLAAGGRRVAEVAALVGYDNPFAFSTAFRRAMGQAPSQLAAGGRPPPTP